MRKSALILLFCWPVLSAHAKPEFFRCGSGVAFIQHIEANLIPTIRTVLSTSRLAELKPESVGFLLNRVFDKFMSETEGPMSQLDFSHLEMAFRRSELDVHLIAAPRRALPLEVGGEYPEPLRAHRDGPPRFGLLIVVGDENAANAFYQHFNMSRDENLARLPYTSWGKIIDGNAN